MARCSAIIVGMCCAALSGLPFWQGLSRIRSDSNLHGRATLNSPNVLEAAERIWQESRIDVRSYGAAGDGVTDDTASCQAALAAGAGQTVLFPPGTYVVDGLEVEAGTHVLLSTGCVLRLKASATNPFVLHSDANNITITGYGATVDANGGSQVLSKFHGIMFSCPDGERRDGVTVEGVTIQDASSRAIAVMRYDNVIIWDVHVEAGDNPPDPLFGLGIYVQGLPARHSQNVVVTRCHFIGNKRNGDGIVFSYIDNGIIADNSFERWGRTELSTPYYSFNIDVEHGGDDTSIMNNTIRDPNAGGIAGKGDRLVVSGNTIEGGPKASNVSSIYITATNEFVCTSNTVLSPGGSGIRLGEDATRGVVVGNTIEGPQDHDYYASIDIYGATDGVEIADNAIVGKGTYANATYGVLLRAAQGAGLPHSVVVHDNRISGFNTTYAIRADDLADHSRIENNTIEDGHSGIVLISTVVPVVDQVELCGNVLHNLTNFGIVIDSAAITNTLICDNTFDNVATPWIDGGTNTTIHPITDRRIGTATTARDLSLDADGTQRAR